MNTLPKQHPEIEFGKIGVLVINLGTPGNTDYWSMRRYLGEFLSDRRVSEINPLIWQPLLQGVILTTRPSKSGAAYDKIWNTELDESPLRTTTRNQTEKLAAMLSASQGAVIVDWAMRYGTPSIESRLKALVARGCERILLAPLYPQYSASTTATANDKAFDVLKGMRWQPAIRTLPPYFDHPAYIDALVMSLREHLETLKWQPQIVLASFHGLPQSYLDLGDPYHCHCHKTTRLMREKLGWGEDRLQLAFQSRFGRAEWIKPYTEATLIDFAKGGSTCVTVITPGFSSDCVETLEEIAIAARDTFLAHGGTKFSIVPCLNDSSAGMAMLQTLVEQELRGWI